jgi:SAM-dependent methyltransferase/regulator of replication initiation timing
MSQELNAQITDWPSFYHLSRLRANLLRPVHDLLRGRILEIGAGCGAVTRFLGETGASVFALEGSVRRAKIAAARCQDMDNVTVIADSFDRFTAANDFDVITLIGVLEYARVFFPSDSGDPVDAMLRHARKLLRPSGILLVAIENQLGLKYFAGFKEDHLGVPMYGIEDLYRMDGVVTFGQNELRQRINSAGLEHQYWWFPFPDYKAPVCFLSEDGIKEKDNIDLSTLLSNSVRFDHQNTYKHLFSLEQAYKPAFRNGLTGDLANSFLVVASDQEQTRLDKPILGCHFSVQRRLQFAKQVIFLRKRDGGIEVKNELLYGKNAQTERSPLSVHLEYAPFFPGTHWQQQLTRIVNTPGWTITDVQNWAKTWFEALLEFSDLMEKRDELSPLFQILGNLFDAGPHNLIVDDQNDSHFFDQEWRLGFPIELGFLVFRSLLYSLMALTTIAQPTLSTEKNILNLLKSMVQSLGLLLMDADVVRYLSIESNIQELASGIKEQVSFKQLATRELVVRKPLPELINACDENGVLRERIYELEPAVSELTQVIEAMKPELINACNENRVLRERISELEPAVSELTQVIEAMKQSRSWRITAPLRMLMRTITTVYHAPFCFRK